MDRTYKDSSHSTQNETHTADTPTTSSFFPLSLHCYVIISLLFFTFLYLCQYVCPSRKKPIIYMFPCASPLSLTNILFVHRLYAYTRVMEKREERIKTRSDEHTKIIFSSSYWKYFDWKHLVDCWKLFVKHIFHAIASSGVVWPTGFDPLCAALFIVIPSFIESRYSLFFRPLLISAKTLNGFLHVRYMPKM